MSTGGESPRTGFGHAPPIRRNNRVVNVLRHRQRERAAMRRHHGQWFTNAATTSCQPAEECPNAVRNIKMVLPPPTWQRKYRLHGCAASGVGAAPLSNVPSYQTNATNAPVTAI